MFNYNTLILIIILSGNQAGKVNLDFENVDVCTVIDTIAAQAHLNIICGKGVSSRMTLVLRDMEWNKALDIVLRATGFSYKRYGDYIYIDKTENLAEEKIEKRCLVKYKVRNVSLDGIIQNTLPLLSEYGIVLDDKRTGQIILYDNNAVQKAVSSLIAMMDRPMAQVMINVRVINVPDYINDAIELKWDFSDLLMSLRRTIAADFQTNEVEGIAGYLDMKVGAVAGPDAYILPDMLSEQSNGITIASGNILVQDNHEASLITGERFGVLVRDASGNTIVQMFTSGFKLTTTPHIINDKHINLAIEVELSDLDKAAALVGRPIVSTFEAEAKIILNNGETAVMVRRLGDEAGTKEKGPAFMHIPLLKFLFSPLLRSKDRTYQYILITPYITGFNNADITR